MFGTGVFLDSLFSWSLSESIAFWQIGCLAVCLGISNAIDIPVRQSFVVDMVGKEHLPNAIALNSSVFNAARIVGPAIAGLLVSRVSLPICFLINALSYGAVIAGYLCMRLPVRQSVSNVSNTRPLLRQAVQWIGGHPEVRTIFLLVSVASLFCMSYLVLMPVLSRKSFMSVPKVWGGCSQPMESARLRVRSVSPGCAKEAIGSSSPIGVWGFSFVPVFASPGRPIPCWQAVCWRFRDGV